MKTIWKYELDITDFQPVYMPAGAELLSVQMQNGKPCLWAKVDPEKLEVERMIRIVGTGHEINSPETRTLFFIDTFQIHGRGLVFHVFEII